MRKQATLTIVVIIVLAILFYVYFSSSVAKKPEVQNPETICVVDLDCVPAQCCHPGAAVNKNFAPNCTDLGCTAVCVPNTLDCGYGKIKCIQNKCGVMLNGK